MLEWMRRHPQLHFTAVLSEAGDIAAEDVGLGGLHPTYGSAARRLGWVHEAALADHPQLDEFDVYVAGPPALVEIVRSTYPPRGATRLYFDSFDYAPPATLTSTP